MYQISFDPHAATKYGRSRAELEEFLLFCIFVCGKNADQTARKLQHFLADAGNRLPFEALGDWVKSGSLFNRLMVSKIGQYDRTLPATTYLGTHEIDLETCTVEDLEKIHGVGLKSSRYFLLHSRANYVCAVLDRHILKYLNDQGIEGVPKTTPPKKGGGKKYDKFGNIFLELASKECKDRGLSLAEFDLLLWEQYRNAAGTSRGKRTSSASN